MTSRSRLWTDDGGQDLIEYALLAALISVCSIVAIGALGLAIDNYYKTSVEAKIP
ncbi:Flp pilus assembly protein, pilin Flp [Luteitalea pratensis]|uniref:Flp pilus assembly protein, pilin Flp n=1 Tax=Luteitalea pratensis TaxID=1855912 RepID=A0A143PV65_LUTPR|nr:Flp family type IVb pilin [Luteitalea pratensis]AMY12261.1 Flp pilus assembly protein, pilin Flp [Luteitalea pratensis]